MNPLRIEATEFSPTVIFSSEVPHFEISGESRPENTGKFYTPIIEWLSEYKEERCTNADALEKSKAIIFEFKFDYFNSTSAKYIMDILYQIDKYRVDGLNPVIKWYYDTLDEDMKEAGEEFEKLIKTPIEFIER